MSRVHLVLDVARLRELFSLEADGRLVRKISVGGIPAGSIAGSVNGLGYLQVNVDGHPTFVHRVAFALANGFWPLDQVDHINGVRLDNRPENLREASARLNQENRKRAQVNSVTGLLGASPSKSKRGGFVAQICIAGRKIYLGTFGTAEDAHLRYLVEKRKHHEGNTL